MPDVLIRDTLLADRVRAAACIVLNEAEERMAIAQIVAGIRRLGIPIPAPANKTVSDALRWEIRRGHVQRAGWGRYAIDRLPRATEYGMRARLASYRAGVTVQPHRHVDLDPAVAAAIQRRRAQDGRARQGGRQDDAAL